MSSQSFEDVRHLLNLYLIALWGQPFDLAGIPAASESAAVRPRIDQTHIRLPSSLSQQGEVTARRVYIAAAVHAAAHHMYSQPLNPESLNARQRHLVELVEDARVEYLAFSHFPGLRRLWLDLHPPVSPDPTPFSTLMWRLSRGLLELEQSTDDDFMVRKAISLFQERISEIDDARTAREIGLRLAHDIGQMRLSMDEGSVPPMSIYRDDNQHLWYEEHPLPEETKAADQATEGVQSGLQFEEATEGRQLAFTDVPQVSSGAEAGYRIEEVTEDAQLTFFQTSEDEETHPSRYPEWFARFGVERENWCAVHERKAQEGDKDWAPAVLAANRPLLAHLRRVVGALRSRHRVLLRKQETGDELDLDAALRAMADIRNGREPDARVFIRTQPQDDQVLALSLLLDLSESVNNPDPVSGRPILDLAREAVLLLAETATDLGSELSLAGFHSQGRHLVDYQSAKRFDEPFDAAAKARLAAFDGRYSTRMGAAIRHATEVLLTRGAHNRIILIMTDGEPSDIDVFDSEHLLLDTRQAVIEARQRGVPVFCVSLDPGADRYVERIFGEGHFLVLDNLRHLPERLSRLFLRLVSKKF
ncbi:nitric oxide reductase activation protein NorD [Halothiobacillus neapolitanus]|uniref:nitric oxide reductase activation protein NorD n=1 Tax=Halothiobacillus neapolitanus TaxID=927 RepID=UPI001414F6A4|nr:VWA domain-containing protein [Halothiobacillus neapolitanus]